MVEVRLCAGDASADPGLEPWRRGELGSHGCAVDRNCEVVLDDRAARRSAQALGIGVRGTLGLVVLAKQIGSLASARPVVEQLRRSGLDLTDQLTEQCWPSSGSNAPWAGHRGPQADASGAFGVTGPAHPGACDLCGTRRREPRRFATVLGHKMLDCSYRLKAECCQDR